MEYYKLALKMIEDYQSGGKSEPIIGSVPPSKLTATPAAQRHAAPPTPKAAPATATAATTTPKPTQAPLTRTPTTSTPPTKPREAPKPTPASVKKASSSSEKKSEL